MSGFCTFSQLGRYGRFANQIFQIAGTIGIARKNGLEPVFHTWYNHDHAERFGSKEDINVHQHFVNPLPDITAITTTIGAWETVGMEWGYFDVKLGHQGRYDLSGHFQSLKYFEHCIDEVRHYMRMKKEKDTIQPFVAIHARRGDYDNAYHPIIPVYWYVEAIKHFPTDSKFLVFSDDKCFISQLADMCEIHGLMKQANNMAPVYANYLDSFAIMKKCNHFIIGNSSYSAAAAILSEGKDKQVIAPATWFGPKYTNITAKDIYCDNWKIM